MPNNFLINGTDLESTYLTDYTIVDAAAYSGTTYTWGGNQDGQLGVNSIATSYPNTWIGFAATNGWIQAEAANNFTMAIQPTAQFGPAIAIYHTGNNIFSQAGDGATTKRSAATLLNQATTDDRIKMISAKSMGCCSIWNNGRLYAWGRNLYGEVGDGTIVRKSLATLIGTNVNWKYVAQGYTTAAITIDGTLFTWGRGNFGALGDGSTANRSSPVQVGSDTTWNRIYVDELGQNGAAIKTDGTLWTWGDNTTGQLGDNSRTSKSSPVQTAAGGSNWKYASTGGGSMAAIKMDGTLWTWGGNTDGQLGDNTQTPRSSPVQTVAGGTNWKYISVGGYNGSNMGAIKTDSSLWMWGKNNLAQVGDLTTTSRSSPVQIMAHNTGRWKYISIGGNHAVAIMAIDVYI